MGSLMYTMILFLVYTCDGPSPSECDIQEWNLVRWIDSSAC